MRRLLLTLAISTAGTVALLVLFSCERPSNTQGAGDIELLTVPSGANITVRKVQGPGLSDALFEVQTPDTLTDLPVASYLFEISKPGFRDTAVGLGIAPDFQVSLNVSLTPK